MKREREREREREEVKGESKCREPNPANEGRSSLRFVRRTETVSEMSKC